MKTPYPHQTQPSATLAVSTAITIALLAALALTPIARGEDARAKGYAIAEASDNSDNGFADSAVKLKMTLRTSSGRSTDRILSIKTLERANNGVGDKSIVIFSSPADIDGTALLSHAKLVDPDDQWLYLPALKRVKRISSKNKSGPFVGSEFAFEDFTALELGKYDYKFLRTESLGGLVCDVVERHPKYQYSGYTKTIGWTDQKDKQLRKVEFYDRKGELLKSLTLSGYKKYDGKFWRAHKFEMMNHQNGKSTVLLYAKYQFGTGLRDSDFVSTALTRTR